ncbi:SDR family oxidoreductase [Roseibium suaedae]|uniref:NAD(P)-dependent dehydrogenase, short-chain alcohol dehydrogenase family n=1 Tax=Roseibium suaedae TaxID=735517 RepID=A0A1M7I2X8_9HYPH|nr:SDR family oxidoreductase [Roseibium suaedae]SHM35008.1 NAD(P)-dependent dehydrogenase, short-chain alcohol dehydrogenase family [Roseibium suaedae]
MSGTVAVVTGAAGDIGLAIAQRLSQTHDKIILADINTEAVTKLCEGNRDKFVPVTCDVTREADCATLAAEAAGHGTVSVLVNNAGAARAVSLGDTTADIFRQDTALNLEAAFLAFQALEADLKSTRGSVVNITSVNGLAVFGHPAYSAAKAGLIHLTKLIAVEYGKYGIRCNAIAPGTVKTQAWEARAAANPNVFEDAKRWYPLQRVVDPKDVANAVAFLSGAEASAITGVCLPVDCGLLAGQAELARTFSQSDNY